ncbi:MAG TPA: hypothetical protein VFQ45_05545 [Longimicrobium sp.]|nr:hypothetical protein [Longimicrobium sp.]
MRSFGFSTGAVALADFERAIDLLSTTAATAIELSALRFGELPALMAAIPTLDLVKYKYVSVHAPGAFSAAEEPQVVELLQAAADREWNIVLHPDTVHDHAVWAPFGSLLCIENMDRRKPIGRTAAELSRIFERLPDASLCFDFAHARQCDTSLTEAFWILEEFATKVAQVHISELDGHSRHVRLSPGGVAACRSFAEWIPQDVPLIIEAPVEPHEIEEEIARTLDALTPRLAVAAA